jgi:hypothetical protein
MPRHVPGICRNWVAGLRRLTTMRTYDVLASVLFK